MELYRPCFRRSGARQWDWSHFRCGKVNTDCYFSTARQTNVWNRLSTRAPLSIINISWHKYWCVYFRFLHFSSAANKWVQLRMNRRCGEQSLCSCHVPGGRRKVRRKKKKTSFSVAVMAEVIAGINLCVIDVLISTPLFAAPLRRASSCWINVRSSYVFRNLTPDSFRPPHNHSRQPVDTAADTSPTSAPHVCAWDLFQRH